MVRPQNAGRSLRCAKHCPGKLLVGTPERHGLIGSCDEPDRLPRRCFPVSDAGEVLARDTKIAQGNPVGQEFVSYKGFWSDLIKSQLLGIVGLG